MIDHEWGFYETGYYSMHFVSKEVIINLCQNFYIFYILAKKNISTLMSNK